MSEKYSNILFSSKIGKTHNNNYATIAAKLLRCVRPPAKSGIKGVKILSTFLNGFYLKLKENDYFLVMFFSS